jgi:regulator of replication initiation timing
MRKRIREAYKRDKLAGVWNVIKGQGAKGWDAARHWSRTRVELARKSVNAAQNELEQIRQAKARKVAERHKLNQEIGHLKEELQHERARPTPDQTRIDRLLVRLNTAQDALAKVKASIKDLRKRQVRVFDRKNNRIDQVQFWIKRNTIYARKYRAAKKRNRERQDNGQPKFEPYMANGYRYQGCTQGVLNFVARAVVIDGNYTTSMYRDYVPPGGSTTSHHLFGRAADVGPSLKTQDREFKLNLGNSNCLEFYGPNNSQNLRYGAQLSQAEGSPNEQLHDTHNHGAFG